MASSEKRSPVNPRRSAEVVTHPSAAAGARRNLKHALASGSKSLSESAEALRALAHDASGSASRVRAVQGEMDDWMDFTRGFQDRCLEAMELNDLDAMIRRRDELLSSLAIARPQVWPVKRAK